ncbi:hypothetical protein A2Z56_00755 [Candidatus Kaiserbacteria bacterium RIFCSPHIGHO2_12_45_16]|nr:MAG: hypothetical protein A2Z56_00755 [Candidatus Kaiserbacteria bacterium RIFCSPHIGHO2_12_45_16]
MVESPVVEGAISLNNTMYAQNVKLWGGGLDPESRLFYFALLIKQSRVLGRLLLMLCSSQSRAYRPELQVPPKAK